MHRWFSISTTTSINKSGITALTKCCDDLIEVFNSTDIIYFYLDQVSIDSLTKVRIKSQTFYRFIEIMEYLACITNNKCILIEYKKFNFPSQGIDQVREELIVQPSQIEFKKHN